MVDHGVAITMPDGVRLRASLYLPRHAHGPLPTVLVRLPYHRLRYGEGYNSALHFARHGYAVVVQDLRGTGDSDGELLPWRDAAEDGVATLDWIARQPWATGKVGTFGCSALGETQLVLSKMNHPAHAAMIPSGAGGAVGSAAGRFGYFGLFEGGVFQLASGFGWFVDHGAKHPGTPAATTFAHAEVLQRLPVSSLVEGVRPAPNGYRDLIATPLGDERWKVWGYLTDKDFSAVPALIVNNWGDQTVGDTLALAEAWRKQGFAPHQKVVIAPGDHCHRETSDAPLKHFGVLPVSNTAWPREEWTLRWFDHWLRGRPDAFDDIKPYNYFMLMENRWYSSGQWPPAEARSQRWFLGSAGKANSSSGNGKLSPSFDSRAAFDSFRYNPETPVPSRGGPVCCTGNSNDKPGPAEQADVESRDDVLVYSSGPLTDDLRIAGPLKAHLNFSSDAPDTDLVVRLVHLWPDGRATSIQEGALRLRYRDGFDQPRLLESGTIYPVVVDMRSIAYLVPKGHSLRLHVTSSSFPRLERNLNTGALNNATETQMRIAVNRVHYTQSAQSYLELPVLHTSN
jgi:putative CocE/NonD family hydrolase